MVLLSLLLFLMLVWWNFHIHFQIQPHLLCYGLVPLFFKISSVLKMFPKLFLLACHYLLFSFWILCRSYNFTHYFLYNNCYINSYGIIWTNFVNLFYNGNLYIWNITIVIIEVDYNDRYIRTYITKINYLHQSKFECLMH